MTEINKYNRSVIYTIRSHQTTKYYIGSTTQSLSKRLTGHKRDYKKYLTNNDNKYMSSYEILQYSDYYIELLIAYPCNNKDELQRKEGEMIRQYKSDVVNMCIPGNRTIEQIVQYKKQYRLDNIVPIAQYNKQYNEVNKASIAERHKEHHKQPIICECGIISNKGHISRHIKSNIHIININQQLFNHELNYYLL